MKGVKYQSEQLTQPKNVGSSFYQRQKKDESLSRSKGESGAVELRKFPEFEESCMLFIISKYVHKYVLLNNEL